MGICSARLPTEILVGQGNRVAPLKQDATQRFPFQAAAVDLQASELLGLDDDLKKVAQLSAVGEAENSVAQLREHVDALAFCPISDCEGGLFFRNKGDRIQLAFLLCVSALIDDGLLVLQKGSGSVHDDNDHNVAVTRPKHNCESNKIVTLTTETLRQAWSDTMTLTKPSLGGGGSLREAAVRETVHDRHKCTQFPNVKIHLNELYIS